MTFPKAAHVRSLHLCLFIAISTLFADSAVGGGLFGSPGAAHLYDSPAGARTPSMFRPVSSVETVFRAQSEDSVPLPPGASGIPGGLGPISVTPYSAAMPVQDSTFQTPPSYGGGYPGSYTPPVAPDASSWNAFSPPLGADPFVTSPGGYPAQPYAPYSPYGAAPAANGGFTVPGVNGPQPFRMGWHNDFDIEFIPFTGTQGGAQGKFEQFGIDYDLGYTGAFIPGWMMTWTNQFRYRGWDGPDTGAGLPGKAFRYGSDFALETASNGPINTILGITPSINSDFEHSLGSGAFQLDARGMFVFQLDQSWSMVLGIEYWDRVKDRIIPHVGLLYRDDFWEWRLMYPESSVSLFLGNEGPWAKWMYARAEYHVEAYEVGTSGGGRDQVELEDYRILLGFRMDAGTYTWFTEGGWVFDRNVNFGNAANADFSPMTGFIGRIGWKY